LNVTIGVPHHALQREFPNSVDALFRGQAQIAGIVARITSPDNAALHDAISAIVRHELRIARRRAEARAPSRSIVEHDANALRAGIVHVDQVAHCTRQSPSCSVFSHLDVTPWAMSVDENEEVRRAVAAVLMIKAYQPPWFGRDRNTTFPDEEDRLLVECHLQAKLHEAFLRPVESRKI
jgi:hypothetical protein